MKITWTLSVSIFFILIVTGVYGYLYWQQANNRAIADEFGLLLSGLNNEVIYEKGRFIKTTLDITLASNYPYSGELHRDQFINSLDNQYRQKYCNLLEKKQASFALHIFVKDLTKIDICTVFLMDWIFEPSVCD